MTRVRKSNISRLPSEQRQLIERLLREDRLTLDEMIAAIRHKFPEAEISRSGLHRFAQPLREMTSRMREIDTAARVVIEELGENPDDKAPALLCQSITTLATAAAMNAQIDGASIQDIRRLAAGAKDLLSARSMTMRERQAIEDAARAKLLDEQKERLATMERKRGMSADVADEIRRDILGIG